MTYKKIPLHSFAKGNEQLTAILKLPFIGEALSAGGIIAGGFVRHVLNGENLYHYLSSPRIARTKQQQYETFIQNKEWSKLFSGLNDKPDAPVSAIPGLNGDIDIFFESKKDLMQIVDEKKHYSYLESLLMEKSLTGLCANIYFDSAQFTKDKIHGNVKTQLVSHFYGAAEEILETFDFTNSQCAIDSQFVYFDENFHALEKKKELNVVSGDSPLTGHRILKYLSRRKLSTITPSSRNAISDWAMRYGGKNWGDHPLLKFELHATSTLSKMIRDSRIFSNVDLLHLIGQIKLKYPILSSPNDKYSIIGWKAADLAIDTIAKRTGV